MSPVAPATPWHVRLTSKRGTGKILWVRADGSLSDYQSDAGRFTLERAEYWRADIEGTMCRWQIDIVPVRPAGPMQGADQDG